MEAEHASTQVALSETKDEVLVLTAAKLQRDEELWQERMERKADQARLQSLENELESLKAETDEEIDNLLHENKELLRKIHKLNIDIEQSSLDASQAHVDRLNETQKIKESSQASEAALKVAIQDRDRIAAEVKKLEMRLEEVETEKQHREEILSQAADEKNESLNAQIRKLLSEREVMEHKLATMKEEVTEAKVSHVLPLFLPSSSSYFPES